MCKRFVLLLLVLGSCAAPAAAQVTGPPNVFTAFTVISPDDVNLNFSTVYDNALNRFAGVMAGNLTWSVDATYDVGAVAGSRMRDLFVGRDVAIVRNITIGGTLGIVGATSLASLNVTGNATVGGTFGVTGATTLSSTLGVTGAGTFTSTLAVNSTASNALDVAGGIQAGSGNVNVIGTDGRIPAISSTYFASVSGANLTGIPEAALNDDSLLARIAANETISGSWTFSGNPTLSNGLPTLNFINSAAGVNAKRWSWAASNVLDLQLLDDSGLNPVAALTFARTGTTPTTLVITPQMLASTSLGATTPVYSFNGDTNTGVSYIASDALGLTVGGSNVTTFSTLGTTIVTSPNFSGAISPAALGAGNNNNYNPANLSLVYALLLQGNGGGSTLTGLAAQAGGAKRLICNTAGGNISVTNLDANSTAANQFVGTATIAAGSCREVWYDPTNTKWRVI